MVTFGLLLAACGSTPISTAASDSTGQDTLPDGAVASDSGGGHRAAGDDGAWGDAGADQSCNSSLDCATDRVCDERRGRCVQCVRNADCRVDERCVEQRCLTACESDNDCTPEGLLCNHQLGVCAECDRHRDCAEDEHCRMGACRMQLCEPDVTRCGNRGLERCDPSGGGFGPPEPCPASSACIERPGGAQCVPWSCTPAAGACADGLLLRCTGDGQAFEQERDCGAEGLACAPAGCQVPVCEPSAVFCGGDAIRRCAPSGQSSTVTRRCAIGTRCVELDDGPLCVATVCEPGALVCDGQRATRCHPHGTYEPGGTDCAQRGERCDGGRCVARACEPSNLFCDARELRRCSSDGSGSAVVTTCASVEYCNATMGRCDPPPASCLPGGCPACAAPDVPCCATATSCGCLSPAGACSAP